METCETKALLALLLLIPLTIYGGFVFAFGWEAFFTPLGAPIISVAHAIGITAVLQLVTLNEKVEEDKLIPEIINRGIYLTVALLHMLVVMQFM